MSTPITPVEQKRKVITAIPGPKSTEIIARRAAAVSASLGMSMPAVIERAGGGILVDVDGNHIIDLGAGIAVVNVGNSAPRVVENVQRQVEAFTHTCFMVAPYLGYIEVCEALNRLTPGKFAKKSVLLNSGAEALENAVKIARSFTKRQAIVVFEHGYHGRTNLTMGMTAKNMPYKDSFGPFTPEIYRMPMAYPYRWEGGAAACEKDALDVVIHKMDKEIGGKNIAAIVIEPIQGEGGFIVPPKGFMPGLAKYAKDNGAGIMYVENLEGDFGATSWVGGCWTDPKFRGAGLMRAMFNFLDHNALERGWLVQGLGVWTDNDSAIAAYEKLGFVEMGGPQPSSRQPGKFYQRMIRKTINA